MGALKEYDTARKYFAHAAMLDDRHPRALWGVLSTNAQIVAIDAKGEKGMNPTQNQQLHGLTVKKLLAIYEPLAKKGLRHAKVTVASLQAMPGPTPRKSR